MKKERFKQNTRTTASKLVYCGITIAATPNQLIKILGPNQVNKHDAYYAWSHVFNELGLNFEIYDYNQPLKPKLNETINFHIKSSGKGSAMDVRAELLKRLKATQ